MTDVEYGKLLRQFICHKIIVGYIIIYRRRKELTCKNNEKRNL